MTLKEIVTKAEYEAVMKALVENRCRIAKTAEALGITRKNLWEKMKKHDIHTEFIALPALEEKAA